MSAPDDVRVSLRAVSDFLAKTPNASKRLLLVAKAFDEYLNGKHISMDLALGLKLGKGKHTRAENENHIEMICKAYFEHLDGKAFKTIAELNGYADKEFRVLRKRYEHYAIERMASTISANDILCS